MQRITNALAKRSSFDGKVSEKKLKEKLKQLLVPENCKNISVPLLNKEVWSQLNSFQCRCDLRMINLQKSLQKVTVAIAQNTDKLLCDGEIDKKAMFQGNLNALSFIGHLVQEISTTR